MNKLAIFTIFALICAMAIVIECKPMMNHEDMAELEPEQYTADGVEEYFPKFISEEGVDKREWGADASFGWGRR